MGHVSASSGKEVVLHLDEATATDLEDFLYCLFELVAADAPVPMPSDETQKRLGPVYREICRQLGHWTIAEAMQAALDLKAQAQHEQ